jgi:broad specificity phosphatase PhoE
VIEQLILVRHGETEHNVRGIAQGWNDSGFSEVGASQVRALALRLRAFEPTALYTSTLQRAWATAEAIGRETGLSPIGLDDLREMNCGRWEGMSFLKVREDDAELYRQWISDPEACCPGGESHAGLRRRMEKAIASIAAGNGKNVRPIVVSHATAIRVITTSLLELSVESARAFAQDNAAINVFTRRGSRFVLKLWNDTTHYGAVKS